MPPGGSTRVISAATAGSRPSGGVSSSGPSDATASGVPASASGKVAFDASTTARADRAAGKLTRLADTDVASRSIPDRRVTRPGGDATPPFGRQAGGAGGRGAGTPSGVNKVTKPADALFPEARHVVGVHEMP